MQACSVTREAQIQEEVARHRERFKVVLKTDPKCWVENWVPPTDVNKRYSVWQSVYMRIVGVVVYLFHRQYKGHAYSVFLVPATDPELFYMDPDETCDMCLRQTKMQIGGWDNLQKVASSSVANVIYSHGIKGHSVGFAVPGWMGQDQFTRECMSWIAESFPGVHVQNDDNVLEFSLVIKRTLPERKAKRRKQAVHSRSELQKDTLYMPVDQPFPIFNHKELMMQVLEPFTGLYHDVCTVISDYAVVVSGFDAIATVFHKLKSTRSGDYVASPACRNNCTSHEKHVKILSLK